MDGMAWSGKLPPSRRWALRAALGLVFLASLSACGRAPIDQPPTIAYGSDICAACGMIISDERYAAGLVYKGDNGGAETLLFDDAGEMIASEAKAPNRMVLRRWVKDADTRQWLNADEAWLVRSERIVTPMATGVAAFSTRAAAEARADSIAAQRYSAMLAAARAQRRATEEAPNPPSR